MKATQRIKKPQTLSTKPCTCGYTMREVIYAQGKRRVGWYCAACKTFDKAVGRERLV